MSNDHRSSCLRAYPVKRILFSGILGVVLTFLLTLGAAILLQREILPISGCRWLGPVIVALSSICAAWVSARRNDKKLLCGFVTVCIYGLSLVICGMLTFSAPMEPGRLTLTLGVLLGGAVIGVVLSAFGE